MKNYDIATIHNIIKNTCEKNGFHYWEVQDCHFIIWLNNGNHKEVMSVWVDELGYVEVTNRFNAKSFEFEDLEYPYDPQLALAIYRLSMSDYSRL